MRPGTARCPGAGLFSPRMIDQHADPRTDDTLVFEGSVAEERETEQGKEIVIDVVGKVSIGAHVTSRVTLAVPA